MTDQVHKPDSEDCLHSPTSIGQNSLSFPNSDDNVPLSFRDDVPSANISNNNNIINNVPAGTTVDETLPLLQQPVEEEGGGVGTTTSNLKEKIKKREKKYEMLYKKTPSATTTTGEAASSPSLALSFDQPPFPIFCKRCLGTNVGKKGERSDTYVITCAKCGAHEVLMKPDGTGVVKMSDPDSQQQALPKGNLMDAVWKSAGEKISSAMKEDFRELKEGRNPMTSHIKVLAQRLQHCSRECADLYPLIVTLRCMQLKKASSTSQQRKNIETQIKKRVSCLENDIHEIESFEGKYFNKSDDPVALAAAVERRKKKRWLFESSSFNSATSVETETVTDQANSSLFDPPPSAPTSALDALLCTLVSEQTPAVTSGQASATAADNASDLTSAASSKTRTHRYIERVEEVNFLLEVMHERLKTYCMIHSALLHNETEEAIAKSKRTEEAVVSSLYDFTLGIVDQCKGTTRDCMQKMEMKKKDIRKKQRLLAEIRILGEQCIANGDEAGLRQIEEMLQQINLHN